MSSSYKPKDIIKIQYDLNNEFFDRTDLFTAINEEFIYEYLKKTGIDGIHKLMNSITDLVFIIKKLQLQMLQEDIKISYCDQYPESIDKIK